MKDSGIEWIGEIPESWASARLKDIAANEPYSIVDGPFGSAISTSDYKDSGIPLIRIVNLNQCELRTDNLVYITEEHASKVARSSFYKGDIIFAKTGATVGKCAFNSNIEYGILSSSCVKIKIAESFFRKYYYYFFNTNQFNEALRMACNGTTRDTINLSPLACLSCLVPSYDEQTAISSHLDRQCAHIDNIIEKTKASIEEYKKLRQAVITQAVTKGVRGDRPMKPTGYEWLKQIPADWTMERGKNLFYETNNRSESGEEELLTVSQYTGVTPRSQKNVYMFEAESLEGYKICEIGDIAANTMWLWAGAIGVSEYYGVISPSYNIYRQKKDAYVSKYLDFLLRIPPIVQLFESMSTGIRASRLRLYPEQFLNIFFPVPSTAEQSKIVSYLQEKIVEVDKLIAKKEEFLTELEAYKKSMIYEYVTGKKEVPSA